MKTNPILKYFEMPLTIHEVMTAAVWWIETIAWKNNNYIPYFGLKLTFTDKVSNSHSCPLDGATNWSNKEDHEPRSYPGWQGGIWIAQAKTHARVRDFKNSFDLSSQLGQVGIHTGTGGGGEYNIPTDIKHKLQDEDFYSRSPNMRSWGFDVKLWNSDYPKIENRNRLTKLLNGESDKPTTEEFWYFNCPHHTAFSYLHKNITADYQGRSASFTVIDNIVLMCI